MSQLFWSSLHLPDGDFVDLAWSQPLGEVLKDANTPLLILFHGLEGSVRSPYADHLMATAHARGWHAVTFHFRGCSGRLNRTHRAYHSGDSADARYFIEWLASRTDKALHAAGFSLGGNMLVKMLGETPQLPLQRAVSTSAPLALGPSSVRIDQGFSKVYRGHLISSLKSKVMTKLRDGQLRGFLDIDAPTLKGIVNFRTFDNLVTAPLHGFKDVDDYYDSCSGLRFLPLVRHPLLIIHAADDPFTCDACIPAPGSYPQQVLHELSPYGGHVGFVGSRRGLPYYYLSDRILDFLAADPVGKETSHADPLSAT